MLESKERMPPRNNFGAGCGSIWRPESFGGSRQSPPRRKQCKPAKGKQAKQLFPLPLVRHATTTGLPVSHESQLSCFGPGSRSCPVLKLTLPPDTVRSVVPRRLEVLHFEALLTPRVCQTQA